MGVFSPHVLACRDQARGDLSVEGGAHRRVAQALLGEAHSARSACTAASWVRSMSAGGLVARLARVEFLFSISM